MHLCSILWWFHNFKFHRNCNRRKMTFNSLMKVVLPILYQLLKKTEELTTGYGLKLDFADSSTDSRLPGLSSKRRPQKMLKASHYDVIDNESSFSETFLDRFYGNKSTRDVMKSLARYVDTMKDFSESQKSFNQPKKSNCCDVAKNFKIENICHECSQIIPSIRNANGKLTRGGSYLWSTQTQRLHWFSTQWHIWHC